MTTKTQLNLSEMRKHCRGYQEIFYTYALKTAMKRATEAVQKEKTAPEFTAKIENLQTIPALLKNHVYHPIGDSDNWINRVERIKRTIGHTFKHETTRYLASLISQFDSMSEGVTVALNHIVNHTYHQCVVEIDELCKEFCAAANCDSFHRLGPEMGCERYEQLLKPAIRAKMTVFGFPKWIEGRLDLLSNDISDKLVVEVTGSLSASMGNQTFMEKIRPVGDVATRLLQTNPGVVGAWLYGIMRCADNYRGEPFQDWHEVEHEGDIVKKVAHAMQPITTGTKAWRHFTNTSASEISNRLKQLHTPKTSIRPGEHAYSALGAMMIIESDVDGTPMKSARGLVEKEVFERQSMPYVQTWPNFIHIYKAFLSQSVMSPKQRKCSMFELTAQLQNILDWARDYLEEYAEIPRYSWKSYLRRSERWHREELDRIAERARMRDVEYYGDKEWTSALGEYKSGPYLIRPLTTKSELVQESTTAKHCVGGRYYADECVANRSRIFRISEYTGYPEPESELKYVCTAEIRKDIDSGDWHLNQTRGIRNSTVGAKVTELAIGIGVLYSNADSKHSREDDDNAKQS